MDRLTPDMTRLRALQEHLYHGNQLRSLTVAEAGGLLEALLATPAAEPAAPAPQVTEAMVEAMVRALDHWEATVCTRSVVPPHPLIELGPHSRAAMLTAALTAALAARKAGG